MEIVIAIAFLYFMWVLLPKMNDRCFESKAKLETARMWYEAERKTREQTDKIYLDVYGMTKIEWDIQNAYAKAKEACNPTSED